MLLTKACGLKVKRVFVLQQRLLAHWVKNYVPDAYPRTEEERIAAAKKYNLRPEDYKPFEDDGFALGDYPDIQPVYEGSRDPYEAYDYYPERRNFKDALPIQAPIYRTGYFDPDERYNTYFGLSGFQQFTRMCSVLAIFFGILGLGAYYKSFYPMMLKQYPYEGETHYTFEKP